MTLPHSSLGIALIAAVIAALQVGDSLGVVAIHAVFKVSPHIKIWGFKSGECGDHCGSHLRLISQSGKRCCSHANDSFDMWRGTILLDGIIIPFSCFRAFFVNVSLRKTPRNFSNQSFSPHLQFQSCSEAYLAKQYFQPSYSFILNESFRFISWSQEHLIKFQIHFIKTSVCYNFLPIFFYFKKDFFKFTLTYFVIRQRL